MRDSWPTLVDFVLRPVRPHLERCLGERERHLDALRVLSERRARNLADCEARIEHLRAAVFAAKDGVVASRMTDLEREWRALARTDPDGRLMDLWARIAPHAWMDRKPWRDSEPTAQLDTAIALAADLDGVRAAESAIEALRAALAPWGTPVATRIRWRPFEHDSDCTDELFAEPLRTAREALSAHGMESVVLERARHVERDVHEAARGRFPERPLLARSLAHAAFVDHVVGAASLAGRSNPVFPLRQLLATGYVLSAIDSSGVTIEIPPL